MLDYICILLKKRMKFIVLGGYGIIGKEVVRDLFKFSPNSQIIIAGRNSQKARLCPHAIPTDRNCR